MPRNRTRYHHTHTQYPAPTPTPTPPLTPTPTPTLLRRRLNSKLVTGTLVILFSLLILLILIRSLPSLTHWPTHQPLPSAGIWSETLTSRSTPRTPHKAIRKTLKTISAIVTELNRTLTTTCPGCVWRTPSGEVCVRTFYDDGDIALIACGMLIIAVLWILGTLIFLEGAADISPPFEMQVRNWGLGGATVAAAAVAFGGLKAQWYWWVLFVLGATFGGMLIGVFVTREELVEKWKDEGKAETESSAYTERGARWSPSFYSF